MYKHATLMCSIEASVVFWLSLRCNGSQRTFTLSTHTSSSSVVGSGDFTLTLGGARFTTKSTVALASPALIHSYYPATPLRVMVPAGAITEAGIVDVEIADSTTSKTLPFTIDNPLPVISATGAFDGVYLAKGAYVADVPELKPVQTVIDATVPSQSVDPEASARSTVATVATEHNGKRGNLLVNTSSMLDRVTTRGNAEVYITQVMPQ